MRCVVSRSDKALSWHRVRAGQFVQDLPCVVKKYVQALVPIDLYKAVKVLDEVWWFLGERNGNLLGLPEER